MKMRDIPAMYLIKIFFGLSASIVAKHTSFSIQLKE